MGNYMDKGSHTFDNNDENVRTDSTEVSQLTDRLSLSSSSGSIEFAKKAGESLNFHIFSYKQYMPCKKRQIYKWASAKLALTEELIRTNQLRSVQMQQCSYLEPDTDYLTDDEMEEVSIDTQLRSLVNYRTELVELIGRLSLNNRSKSQKRKKSRRLKRRKLIPKCQYNINITTKNGDDSEMSDSSKLGANTCRDKIIKRSPLKVKNY
ncbi:uncharacterized protein ACRADG_006294 [Cochliomyia hominivorax]